MSEQDVISYMEDDKYICFSGRLKDRFGDNGIVSVLIAEAMDAVAHIRLFILSCRVFKRDMEYAMLDSLIAVCARKGLAAIRGYYYSTERNGIVKELYKDAGFRQVDEMENVCTVWEMNVAEYKKKNMVIQVEEYGE